MECGDEANENGCQPEETLRRWARRIAAIVEQAIAMSITSLLRSTLVGMVVMIPVAARAGGPQPADVAVTKTFDAVPFSYHIELAGEKDAMRVYRLRYPSPVRTAVAQNNTIFAELYLPKGIEPGSPRRPAVICLHILDGNVELVQVACTALAARGIPAVWFNLPYYGARSPLPHS